MTSTNGASSVALDRLAERLEELLAAERRRQHLVVQVDLRQAGDRAEQHVLDAGLAGRRDGDRVAVAAHPLRDPEDVDLLARPEASSVQSPWSIPPVRSSSLAPPARARPPAAPRRACTSTSRPPQRAQRSGKPPSGPSVPHAPAHARRPGHLQVAAPRPRPPCPARTSSKANSSADGHDLAQVADLQLDRRDAPAAGVRARDPHHGVGDRRARASADPRQRVADELVHHAPAAERGLDEHHAGRLGLDLADLAPPARSRAPRAARRAPRRRPRARRRRRACPRWRRTSGRCRAARPRPRRPGGTGHVGLAHERSPRREARASSLSTEATPPRVASRTQRRPGPGGVEQRVDRRPQRARVGLRSSASSSNSPRASMIAVPCSPIEPGQQDPVARAAAPPATGRARGSLHAEAGRADVHAVGVAALDDLRVAGDDLDVRGARRRAAIASTSARSSSAPSPSSRTSESVSASGRAPATARSLTVPLTASSPIEPPGKRIGLTTKLSVVSARPRAVDGDRARVAQRVERRRAERGQRAGPRSARWSPCRRRRGPS